MGKRRRTTEELVEELREFHHDEAADRLEWLQKKLDATEAVLAVSEKEAWGRWG